MIKWRKPMRNLMLKSGILNVRLQLSLVKEF